MLFIIIFVSSCYGYMQIFQGHMDDILLLQNSLLLLLLKLKCISLVKKNLHHVNQMMMFIYTYRRESYEFQASYHKIIKQLSVNYTFLLTNTMMQIWWYFLNTKQINYFYSISIVILNLNRIINFTEILLNFHGIVLGTRQ